MNVNPIGAMHPSFGTWLERRRERMRAQIAALEDERYQDLAELMAHDVDERPPLPQSEGEREQYRDVVREHERLAERLAEVRRRLLSELKDVERRQVRGPPGGRYRGLGGSVDGYL